MDLKSYLRERKILVDDALKDRMPNPGGPASTLSEAMAYSLFAGGKRLRPILCMAGASAAGGDEIRVLPIACALELIHTYSLIHDDLPVMDNDDLRRGKATNHKVFGDAIALLAGDGLLTEAFYLLTEAGLTKVFPADSLVRVSNLIARAAGYRGMVGGQTVDILLEGTSAEPSVIEYIHTHKTGELITVSVAAGCILGGGTEQQIEAVSTYGRKIGLAFQIYDDILDVEGDAITMGKSTGADGEKGKNTYPSIMGLEKSKAIQAELIAQAIESLQPFNHRAEPLRQIARYIIERKK